MCGPLCLGEKTFAEALIFCAKALVFCGEALGFFAHLLLGLFEFADDLKHLCLFEAHLIVERDLSLKLFVFFAISLQGGVHQVSVVLCLEAKALLQRGGFFFALS